MAITSGLESLANLEATEAQTEAVKQSTFERKETFETRKRAAEVTLEQAEYTFAELQSNRDTRDALDAVKLTTAQQLHKAMVDKPHLLAASIQVEVDTKLWKLESEKQAMLYDYQFAKGQAIQQALEDGNAEQANFHLKSLQEDWKRMTGLDLDLGMDTNDPEFKGLTMEHLPAVKDAVNIAQHMGPYAREREKTWAAAQGKSDLLGDIKKTLDIKGATKGNAGKSFFNLSGSLSEGITLTGTGDIHEVPEGKSRPQIESLINIIEEITGVYGDSDQVATAIGKDFINEENSEGWGDDNFTYHMPIGELAEAMKFSKEAFEAKVIREAERKGISRQKEADIQVADGFKWYANMVTKNQQR